jgi:hypothetical protein
VKYWEQRPFLFMSRHVFELFIEMGLFSLSIYYLYIEKDKDPECYENYDSSILLLVIGHFFQMVKAVYGIWTQNPSNQGLFKCCI